MSEHRKEQFIMRQFNGAGQGIDHCLWVCNPYELHVLMYDVRIIGCERFEVYSLAPNGGWDEPAQVHALGYIAGLK